MTRSSLGVYALGAATLLVAGYAAATDVRSAGQVPVEGRAVLAVDQRFNAAILANDTAVFNAVLAPEYLFITSTGSVRTRDEVIGYYAAGDVNYRVYRADSVRVRVFGDAAVLTSLRVTEGRLVSGPRVGTDLSGRYRSTRVYVRRAGKWQLVSTHESRIASP